MDEPLRNALWNVLHDWYFKRGSNPKVAQAVWSDFLIEMVDLFDVDAARIAARERMAEFVWSHSYDLVEFVATISYSDVSQSVPGDLMYNTHAATFLEEINRVLATHMAGWHLLAGKIIPITSQTEIETVDDALAGTAPISTGASHHLRAAVAALSDRAVPDYANAIRESFLAVEGVAKAIAGLPNADLEGALKAIGHRSSALDGGLVKGWRSMYGRLSNTDGVRHAGTLAPVFSAADARYMLVTASAFINLLLTYDTHNAAVDYVPESEIPPSDLPGFEANTADTETTVTA